MASSVKDSDTERRYPKRIRKSVVREHFIKTSRRTSQKPPDPPSVTTPHQKTSKSWKPEDQEKFNLNLETYGDQDVVLLTSKIAQKTPNPTTVYNYLQRHKEFVSKDGDVTLPRQKRLQKWLECIREKKLKVPQPNPTALSMLLISLLEDHPVPTDGEVNFAEAYEFMFELLSGRNYVRQKKCLELKYSEPTLKFIRLTVLGLLKDTVTKMDVLHDKFVQSANDEVPTADKNLDQLPDHVQQLLEIGHFNPLGLNEDALMVDVPPIVVDAPSTPNVASDTLNTAPTTPPGTPNIAACSPMAPGTPNTASCAPNMDSGTPNTASCAPNMDSGTPDTASCTPNTASGTPALL